MLFGDASYDYKNREPNDDNFVPIYQSPASFSLYSSFCTDDYYGFLDDNDGKNMLVENLDIGIGRMPVKTVARITYLFLLFIFSTYSVISNVIVVWV